MPNPTDFDGLYVEPDLPPDYKSGFVAVVGRPNVGKSTLMNAILGEKVAIVSPRPQTTRAQQLGILTDEEKQIIFVDTPGIHDPRNRLGDHMVKAAQSSIPDADIVLFIVDVADKPNASEELIADRIADLDDEVDVLLALNKRDLVDEETLEAHQAAYTALVPDATPLVISALEEADAQRVLEAIVERLPEGPRFYPADQITDARLRDNVAEIVREKALTLFDEEVPHAVAVSAEEFKRRSNDMTYVRVTIYVEKEGQKRIIIGKGGSMIKKLNQMARPDIEKIVGTTVYLDLWVKVLKNWRKDKQALRRLGYWRK